MLTKNGHSEIATKDVMKKLVAKIDEIHAELREIKKIWIKLRLLTD